MTRLEGMAGCTDGRGRIWLDDRLTEIEKRCALTHELLHILRRHDGHQDDAAEAQIREETARVLVPMAALQEHAGEQISLWALAEDLHVTEAVLRDRLNTASAGEWEVLRVA
ncbi:ImmA/IrrE family metallo-endopeptidase [Kocuria coralli]|uniref:ImmA/IrrE family metallo-endopeptidase n=1 Tax=Kocuria coralli TaxID=1461025 RepID=UPI0015F2CE73|nr:ImmA/IrrE family metallo-endopeptidase [Kocuria coralli]